MNLDEKLYITQVIPRTIQGEGNRMGYPSTLIRLSKCNLKCSFCDTKESWKQGDEYITEETIYTFLNKIENYKMQNIILTGGEPFLYANNELFWSILEKFNGMIEVETNGTLITNRQMIDRLNKNNVQINLSPKLDIECYKNRIDYKTLISKYQMNVRYLKKYTLKFISTKNNIDDILEFQYDINCDPDTCYLMPFTPQNSLKDNKKYKDDYEKSAKQTLEVCLENNIKFSPRLHIPLFGNDVNEITEEN